MSIKINIGDDMSYIKELAKQNQPKTNRFTGTAQGLIDSQRAAQIEAAKMANQQNLSALDNSAAQLPSYYGTVKDNAAAAKSLGQQAFNEYAAGSGLNTGAGGQAMLARQNTYGNALASADRDMANKLSDIELQRNQYQSQLAQQLAGINADSAANSLNQYNTNRNYDLSQNQQELTQSQYDRAYETQQDEIAYNRAVELAEYAKDYSAMKNFGWSDTQVATANANAQPVTYTGGPSPDPEKPTLITSNVFFKNAKAMYAGGRTPKDVIDYLSKNMDSIEDFEMAVSSIPGLWGEYEKYLQNLAGAPKSVNTYLRGAENRATK